jgi:hypothetical protein
MKIYVGSEAFRKYAIPSIRESYVRSSYRQSSLVAVEEKLLQAYGALLLEANKFSYPSVGVASALNACEEALLLLSVLETDVRTARRPGFSLAGTTQPVKALKQLHQVRQHLLDQRLIEKAISGETNWFKPEHWERLRSIRPDLAPAAAGDD